MGGNDLDTAGGSGALEVGRRLYEYAQAAATTAPLSVASSSQGADPTAFTSRRDVAPVVPRMAWGLAWLPPWPTVGGLATGIVDTHVPEKVRAKV